jgi:dTDP-4-dehydrorhamnose reductase
MQLKYKIVITGGNGRFGSILKKKYQSKKIFYPNKKQLNILSTISVKKYLKKIKPKILIHLAGLSRPMTIHEDNISKSIDLNIVGTANIVKICSELKIKLIYFSTNYVYPGKKGNYKETDPVLPINNYAWSKLGGEAAVQMYKNSLILRVCMTEEPFLHNKTFIDFKTNFTFHENIANFLFKALNLKGLYNIGGKTRSAYKFATQFNKKTIPISIKSNKIMKKFANISMNLNKIKKYSFAKLLDKKF